MNNINNILETYVMPDGFSVDMDEGFTKLTERQFGGKPGRAFGELIQNAIDSYPSGTPWEDRSGEIESGPDWISIRDFGEGMNTERLRLLVTMGGTDKFTDPEKIGQFGMGFMAMFNRKLGTRKIIVITRCEGQTVRLIFDVKEFGKRPALYLDLMEEKINFSTLIRVEFDCGGSVKDCLEHAKRSLTYYPCKMKINGYVFSSEWEWSRYSGNVVFKENGVHGLIRNGTEWRNIAVLCKYECILNTTLDHFITGGHNAHYNLRDFRNNKTPYLPGINILLNIDNLRVTISRDSYYLDWAYTQAVGILNRQLKSCLLKVLISNATVDLVIANHYIFSEEISNYLSNPEAYDRNLTDENRLIVELASFPVYRLNGRTGTWSLKAINSMKSEDLPVFISPNRTNLRWLGGSFRHDFIVLPDPFKTGGGATDFYDSLFKNIFRDMVNLDTIRGNNAAIVDLVKRNIVKKAALSPKIEIFGEKQLAAREEVLLRELGNLLVDPVIMGVIEKNLHLHIRSIRPVFFSLEDKGMRISTGLFDKKGNPVSEDFISNFLDSEGKEPSVSYRHRPDLLLGLSLDNPFIQHLVRSKNVHRNYYALTYLAHELALCQKMLVPYSPFYHLVKQKLALDMRMALMRNLCATLRN
jgi:hypothetical protein